MKFKFKATLQDWLIFLIFAVVGLFVVAIFVNNLASAAAGEGFAGLNPFPAFVNHLDALLILYLLLMVFIFVSCKSYFFEREEGFGFSIGKKEKKGYSDWCKPKEMKSPSGTKELHAMIKSGLVVWLSLAAVNSFV